MAKKEIPLPQRILDTAEKVLRRHGAEKANVVDIARLLGMSHANIYRHFPNKRALLDAVIQRWTCGVESTLQQISDDADSPAGERLGQWFETLRRTKLKKLKDDPELFAVYRSISKDVAHLVQHHVGQLLAQLQKIIAAGVASGEFSKKVNPATAAKAFLQATAAFHHPAMVMLEPLATEADAKAVLAMLLAGLKAGAV